MRMRKFAVIAKCGHVGRGRYVEREFPVIAESASAAAQIILCAPKVKKQLKNAITSVREICETEYEDIKKEWDSDIYIHSPYKAEHPISLEDEVIRLEFVCRKTSSFESRGERLSYRLRKNSYERKEGKYGILVYA